MDITSETVPQGKTLLDDVIALRELLRGASVGAGWALSSVEDSSFKVAIKAKKDTIDEVIGKLDPIIDFAQKHGQI